MNEIKNGYKLLVIAQSLEMISEKTEYSHVDISEETRDDIKKVVKLIRACNKLVNLCSDVITKNIDEVEFGNNFKSQQNAIVKLLSNS
jgi:hypothetical protein